MTQTHQVDQIDAVVAVLQFAGIQIRIRQQPVHRCPHGFGTGQQIADVTGGGVSNLHGPALLVCGWVATLYMRGTGMT
ncbi:MAG: hypothetical protein R3F38_14680 [Gammaproteobacteria bacterium]